MPPAHAAATLALMALAGVLSAVDYYVSPTGSNSNSGLSLGTAFQSITHAATKVNPGDRVLIADGTYHGAVTLARSGNASASITFRAINRWGAKIVANTGSNGLWINANYIEIDGLEVTNPGGHGINCEGRHHIRVLNCHVHNCGNSGISGAWSDFYHFEGNVCHHNAKLSWYSGISIYQATGIGDDSPGYHIIIRGNICHSNLTAPANGPHTDGNGIIIDDWNHTQNGNPDPPYPYGALVENNLCFNNGGAGLKVVWSDHILLRNNTSYGNNTDAVNDGTYRGDLYCQQSRGCVWVNNLSWAIPGTGILSHNTAMMDKGTPSGNSTTANIWRNNLFFNGTAGQPSVATGDGSAPVLAGNLAGVHPKLVAPGMTGSADFHLLATSPAIDAGSAIHGTPTLDGDGLARPVGTAVDIGRYEYRSAGVNTGPVLATPIPDRSATIGVAFSFTLAPGSFTDADGDALTWTSDESLDWLVFSAGTRTFSGTPAIGDLGSTPILVTVSDGSLSASDTFVLTVTAPGDTTPPAKPAAPATTSTTSATPTLSGLTEAWATVRIFDNGVLIATLNADGAGAWSWTPSPPLDPGSHSIRVTAADAAGNTSPSSNAVHILVSDPAAAPGGSPGGGPDSDADGACGAGSALALLAAFTVLGLHPRRRCR